MSHPLSINNKQQFMCIYLLWLFTSQLYLTNKKKYDFS